MNRDDLRFTIAITFCALLIVVLVAYAGTHDQTTYTCAQVESAQVCQTEG